MNIFEKINTLQHLPQGVIDFIQSLSLYAEPVNDGDTAIINTKLDYTGEGKLFVEFSASNSELALKMTLSEQDYIAFNAQYNPDQFDWQVVDDITLNNVPYGAEDFWRLTEELAMVTDTIDAALTVEV
jgi:hypothetical protein